MQIVLLSLFETDPEVRGKYFPHMKTDADVEKHGLRVMNAIGAMVKACKDEDDGKLVKKIHEARSDLASLFFQVPTNFLWEC